MSDGLVAGDVAGEFRLTGPAGFARAAVLLPTGAALFAAAPVATVDLTGVTSVDSATLALLLEWQRQAGRVGRTVTFTGMPVRLAALARLSGVAGLLALAGGPQGSGVAGSPASPASSSGPAESASS